MDNLLFMRVAAARGHDDTRQDDRCSVIDDPARGFKPERILQLMHVQRLPSQAPNLSRAMVEGNMTARRPVAETRDEGCLVHNP